MATEQVTLKKMGRPSTFTQEIADEICEHLAIGESLRTVCRPDHMPSVATIFNWFKAYPEFLEQYARAKQESADAMAEDILDIADDSTNDWMEQNADEDAKERYSLNGENIQRARLRVDTRKWLMAKMKPKKYGDKLDLTSDGKELPTPILGIIAPSNTIHDNNREIIEGEVSKNAGKHKLVPNPNIMDDISVLSNNSN